MSRAPLSSALPSALFNTRSSKRALLFGRKRSICSASSAVLPRIIAAKGRTFRADMSEYRSLARYSMVLLVVSSPCQCSRLSVCTTHHGRPTTDKFRGQDLNLRPPGYEPGELPLLHPGIVF